MYTHTHRHQCARVVHVVSGADQLAQAAPICAVCMYIYNLCMYTHTPKLHQEVKAYNEVKHFETTYVVKMHQHKVHYI